MSAHKGTEADGLIQKSANVSQNENSTMKNLGPDFDVTDHNQHDEI